MEREMKTPKTLMEAIRYFGKPGVALDCIAKLRWPETGPVCEKCGLFDKDILFLKSAQRWKCRGCKNQFSVKRGTIMEDSALSLDKWLCGIWMLANCKNGISSYEVSRALGITQKSAWFMLHRIRLAMKAGSLEKLSGTVEADETFVGPKVNKMNKSQRRKKGRMMGTQGKMPVLAVKQRDGDLRAIVVENTKSESIVPFILENIETGSNFYTDEGPAYRALAVKENYNHEKVNHLFDEYARGDVHTNSVENFWSLLKRSIRGTYVNVEPFHLFRYVEEHAFRFNAREDNDGGRFSALVSMIFGKRLTYDGLTGGAKLARC